MKTVFDETKMILFHGQPAVLCRIIKSEGSAPRKTGSTMVVTAEGKTYGSVGGGNLELFCIEKAREVHGTKVGFTREFCLDAARRNDLGMICGGDVTVEFIYIPADVSQKELDEVFGEEAKPIRVWIFGAGHVGKELCPVLEHLGFEVYMVDDRPDYISPDLHPKAAKCILGAYEEASTYEGIAKEDYVAIMTHGHVGDRLALLQACRINPSYIGCIGSRRKIAATQQFLRENGIGEDVIESIHSPIGIELYGDTPPEIAVSVAAEMIRERALASREA